MGLFWSRITAKLWEPFYMAGFKDGLKYARRLPPNYLIMSRELLEDYKRQAAKAERDRLTKGQG